VSEIKSNSDHAIIKRTLINAVRHDRMLEILLTDKNQELPFKEGE